MHHSFFPPFFLSILLGWLCVCVYSIRVMYQFQVNFFSTPCSCDSYAQYQNSANENSCEWQFSSSVLIPHGYFSSAPQRISVICTKLNIQTKSSILQYDFFSLASTQFLRIIFIYVETTIARKGRTFPDFIFLYIKPVYCILNWNGTCMSMGIGLVHIFKTE